MSRTALLAFVLLAGCAEAPVSAPPERGEPAADAGTILRQPTTLLALKAIAEARAREDIVRSGLDQEPILFTVEAHWFPSANEVGEPLLPREKMPLHVEADPAAVPVWEFTFSAGDWTAVVLVARDGEVLRSDVWFLGIDVGEMVAVQPPLAEPSIAYEAMKLDPRSVAFLEQPIAYADWSYLGGPDASWTASFHSREGEFRATWSATTGLANEVYPPRSQLVIQRASALRESHEGDAKRIALEVTLAPDAAPAEFGDYDPSSYYMFPGPMQIATPGKDGGAYATKWLQGSGEDDRIDAGDRVRIVYDLPGYGLRPGQHVAIRLGDVGSETLAGFDLPTDFGSDLEIPLTT